MITRALDERWADFDACGVSDVGLFMDWSSLYQQPRTPEQSDVFGQSLRAINLWYAHQHTTVWLVTGGRAVHGHREMGYHDKGWTTFEYELSHMIKVCARALACARAHVPQHVQVHARDRAGPPAPRSLGRAVAAARAMHVRAPSPSGVVGHCGRHCVYRWPTRACAP